MDRLRAHWRTIAWLVLLLLALLIRLSLIPRFAGFVSDLEVYGKWAQTLTKSDLQYFYRFAKSPDHLPGDLHVHNLIAHAFKANSGKNFFSPEYQFALKAIPAVADILLAILVFCFVRPRAGHNIAMIAGLVVAFNPGFIYLSAIWGQWDVISAAIFMGGLIVLWSQKPRPLIAAVLFGWALLIKPPLLLLLLPAIVGFSLHAWRQHKQPISRIAIDWAAMFIVAFGTVTALMWPFDMSWLPGWKTYALTDQLKMAANLYPNATMGAANFWMIPQGAPFWVNDSTTFLGIPYHTWGLGLFAIAAIVTAVRVWQNESSDIWLVWSMAVLGYAYFLLPTRSHERYLFPAVMMLIVLAALTHWKRVPTILMIAASLTYLVNLQIVYLEPTEPWRFILFEATSIANVVVFLILLLMPAGILNPRVHELTGATQTKPELHPVE